MNQQLLLYQIDTKSTKYQDLKIQYFQFNHSNIKDIIIPYLSNPEHYQI